MYRGFTCLILTVTLAGLTSCQKSKIDVFAPIFGAHGAAPETTTLVIKRLSDNKIWISNSDRANQRYIPASTSKIPHTLIALEAGQATPETSFKWDGRERTFKSWNQDQTLTSAYQRSAVWVYQEITQGLGGDAMNAWLSQFNYGNRNIGGSDNITEYWLTGPLKISASEQVRFLTQLSQKQLPLSQETYAMAWPIFRNETTGHHTLFAKTGWMHDETAIDIGWFVGWVEDSDLSETYVFALNMEMPNRGDQKKRKPIVIEALKSINAWPVD